ncbi:MAG: ABC transporter substrate-binding protein [Armatimonadetes bacterium]|nr:ABC transporter substrate-binding protein [Armatimonadota bacterium]
MRGKFWALAALTTLAFVIGCEQPQRGIEGRPIDKPKRIVSLSPSTTEIVSQIGLSNSMQGRSSSCDFPAGVKQVPVVVDGTKPDFEKIAQIRPEVIIFDGALFGDDVKQKLLQTGATLVDVSPTTIAQYEDQLLDFGSMTGTITRVSDLVDKVHNAAETAASKVPEPRVKGCVLMAGSGEFLTAGKGSFVADVLKTCGVDVIGPDTRLFAPFPVEQLVAGDPEIVFTGFGEGEKILKDPRLASTKAVRLRHVYEVRSDILYRTGARVEAFIDSVSNQVARVAEGRTSK